MLEQKRMSNKAFDRVNDRMTDDTVRPRWTRRRDWVRVPFPAIVEHRLIGTSATSLGVELVVVTNHFTITTVRFDRTWRSLQHL